MSYNEDSEKWADLQRLAEMGMHVFRLWGPVSYMVCSCGNPKCENVGKHPRVTGDWEARATNRLDSLVRQWRATPDANIGIACGPSNLLVIDEDSPGDFATFCADQGQDVPTTMRVQTANGQHYYFRRPGGLTLGNSEGDLAELNADGTRKYSVNVRGIGGYVVGPGSVHATGVLYTVANPDTDILSPPGWLTDHLRSGGAKLTADEVAALDLLPPGTWSAYGRMATVSEIQKVRTARNGYRNSALNNAAFRLGQLAADRHIAIDVIERRLSEAGLKCGLGESEVTKTINSGIRGGLRQPRSAKAV